TIRVPHLADSLEAIADGGADVFYTGHIGAAMSQHVRAGDGALTMEDLGSYRAIAREALIASVDHWQIATNPPPAVGGAVLTAMLLGCRDLNGNGWDAASLHKLIQVHRACLDFRRDRLEAAADIDKEVATLIAAARDGRLLQRYTSASTVHTSVVDDDGLGCSITASAGYGSGEMPAGTGLWLNNGLGEVELNPAGVAAGIPGERLPSNMAPSIARSPGKVLAIGTPGADRITTALHQVLVNRLEFKMSLEDAIAHPRLHVDTRGDRDRLMAEQGLDLPDTDLPVQIFPELNMYFGGVGAALYDEGQGFEVASDPRRAGGTGIWDG
ncbi:MAG: gamma-glutamyltransferase, partial [Gammaproteobacteria bacterium]|nr:gamma-glutamyltransferase [Gammaproteobacteria bacterium]